MKIITSVKEMQELADELRCGGKRIGFVPTMGYLHEGHLSLVDIARRHCDVVVVSIYVNPTQFGRGEDFSRYPRDLTRDRGLTEQKGVDILFVPSDSEMYLPGHSTFIEVEGISHVLEGEIRPGHFKGVATVVAKLFNIVKPHVAVFGQKDAQQAFIIKRMVNDLNFGIEVIIGPIVRERDGLAMSSRNVYLSVSERDEATILYQSLMLAGSLIKGGESNLQKIESEMLKLIGSRSTGKVDYITFVNPDTFQRVETTEGLKEVLCLIAVRFGSTRLIDNMNFYTG
ncbi:MAG: pantoate--beta-alanine ligase [Candidatus Kryptoniota bacterium]